MELFWLMLFLGLATPNKPPEPPRRDAGHWLRLGVVALLFAAIGIAAGLLLRRLL